MSTNIRTFEYSFDGLIFEYEIDIRIFGYIFSKEFIAKYLCYVFYLIVVNSRNTLILCLRKGSIQHIVILTIEHII
jgi:hypothetical protein